MSGPLAGRRILVTRRREQAAALVDALQAAGAEVVAVPLLELSPPSDPALFARALDDLERYAWAVFTSVNAVEVVADALEARGGAWPASVQVASVGPSTSAALTSRLPGARVALQPASEYRAAGLLDAFGGVPLPGARVLVPCSERARPDLVEGLRARGAEVDAVPAYGVATPGASAGLLAAALGRGVHLATFASPSAVQGFLTAGGEAARRVPAAVIGPVTEAAARAAGLGVAAVAAPSTTEGLVAAIVGAMGGARSDPGATS